MPVTHERLLALVDQLLEPIRRYHERSNPTGMTRPPRDPDERKFLQETGPEGPYMETPGDDPTG
jgi:hypothetical protein